MSSQTTFQVRLKKESDRKEIPVDEWDHYFQVTYQESLRFSSDNYRRQVRKLCPYLLRWAGDPLPSLFSFPQVTIDWVDEQLGYGLFALEEIPFGTLIGEYTGLVRPLSRKDPDPNGYCVHYPTRFWSRSYTVIDALNYGNETRFINHSDQPNLKVICFVDDGFLHFYFQANQDIDKGAQLTCNYGQDYWQFRKKI